ncbi:MAG: hypothetical protein ACSHX6_15100 [Akkermansiaceae bacterium]
MKIEGLEFTQDPEHTGWLIGNESSRDDHELAERCLNWNQCNRITEFYAVCGSFGYENGYTIYLIPRSIKAAELIKIFSVGDHAKSYLPKAIDEFYTQSEKIEDLFGITPFFADVAGFKFTLNCPIEDKVINKIDEIIQVGGEAMWEYEITVGPYLSKNRYLHLWVD